MWHSRWGDGFLVPVSVGHQILVSANTVHRMTARLTSEQERLNDLSSVIYCQDNCCGQPFVSCSVSTMKTFYVVHIYILFEIQCTLLNFMMFEQRQEYNKRVKQSRELSKLFVFILHLKERTNTETFNETSKHRFKSI